MASVGAENLGLLSQKDNPATSQIKVDTKGSKADSAATGLSADFQNFMKMLTVQLKNQDPTSPLDTNQFTQQLVMFTGVEQQVATNKNLEQIISTNTATQLGNAVNYIGKMVEAEGDVTTLKNGHASFSYDLPSQAKEAVIVITNNQGQMVFYGSGTTNAGKNVINWEGTDSFSGGKAPDGDYKVAVYAKDTSNANMTAKMYALGQVQGVDLTDGEVTLQLASGPVPLSKIISIKAPAEAPAPQADNGFDLSDLLGDLGAVNEESNNTASGDSDAG